MPVSDEGGTIRLTGPDGTVIYEGPGRIVMDPPETGGMTVLPGVQAPDEESPRNWGLSFDLSDLRSADPVRSGEPTVEQVVRWESMLVSDPEHAEEQVAAEMARARVGENGARRNGRLNAYRQIARAYGVPENVLGVQPPMVIHTVEGSARDAYEEYLRGHAAYRQAYEEREWLMAGTRAEFPPDPYRYGEINPEGPMHWSPPDEGEDVASCPA